MTRKKFYVVIDTETMRLWNGGNFIYDLGFAVCDKNGNIYEKHSFLIAEGYTLMKNNSKNLEWYSDKVEKYDKLRIENKVQYTIFDNAIRVLKSVVEEYKISTIFAYNASFDKRALSSTYDFIADYLENELPKDIEFNCIWHMACQVLCVKKKYVDFCKEHNLFSECGNIKTSAETVYQYLLNNPTYEEEHTALEDVLIEIEILAKCFSQHKKMDKSIRGQCWRIAQNNAINKGYINRKLE